MIRFVNKIPKKLLDKSGIYVIKNSRDNRVYVGSTVNFFSRFKSHRSKLLSKKHHCTHLQLFFNKYEDVVFTFYVVKRIESPTKQSIEKAENKVMADYDNKFNTNPSAYSMLGFYKDRVLKSKRKASQSESYKDKVRLNTLGDKNPNSILNSVKVKKIKKLIIKGGYTRNELAAKFSVSIHCIKDIKAGGSWGHIIV